MKDKIGRYEFLAEPFHCDFSNRLFMGHLGNHLLYAADFHSNDRGFGMNYLNPRHKTWVLSRLVIEMDEMPKAYTRFAVETWVESAMRFFTNRNFMVQDVADGHIYGYGRSVWAMIDTDTRQPTDLLAINDGTIVDYVEASKSCPIAPLSRVKMGTDTEAIGSTATFYSDVDVNGHVNSVKYIEHVLNLWPIDWYRKHRLRRVEVAYVAESHGGDTLLFFREEHGTTDFSVRVCKCSGEGEAPVKVARCRVLFE